ncbi:hypothetical protein SEA_GANCHO_59 [Mycobacterium phage Gancho]|uniref:Uncharacterized protein n=1 Tax=Mycobacterium phage Gancho TaxID=2301613 RepID=A0A385UCY5_9CAUD|nr:hypothetical protein SEA_GANCHO_59 [Mycobacterium phage Gancho]
MSNKSRARGRVEAAFDEARAAEANAPHPDDVADVTTMAEALETGDTKSFVSKWAGLVLRDRDRALANPEAAVGVEQTWPTADRPAKPEPVREPTPFEAAVLFALGNRTVVRPTGGAPIHLPVNVMSPIYGGTVEPETVAARRRRNKAARAARKGRRVRVYGRVYQSRFGYAHRHNPLGLHDIVDAEVVDE